MWRSVVTCVPVQIKPISKRSQYSIEDLQTLQQEQLLQESTSYNRQVLPNIRPIPKSKFVYKGLAYKEVQKIPGIIHDNNDDHNIDVFKKPLINYNLAQAYVRYEVNASRTKQIPRQPPSSTITTATTAKSNIKDQQLLRNQTSLDLREMRKRIVKGTTLSYRPAPQSASWTPGRADNKSSLGSEVLLPTQYISTNTNFRPSTSKSSIPQKQTTALEMPILTKYVKRPRSITRRTPTPELVANET
ncbi:unnamed protein product [Rotaria sp. Silwood1]|nr:unnamed protein product [Rotaria sp. Silwood1]CAF3386506.1 unnamed protein product [Rotaria sp. Silwood1]CAF3410722.1 unnamed protein product [Rotaria sp. Silwood1]CAF3414603.1 unnamed protein product [Rotaria sp. Silwood1]CAF4569391.1 unnamed protein product [Rotaria sp. Silwood1]